MNDVGDGHTLEIPSLTAGMCCPQPATLQGHQSFPPTVGVADVGKLCVLLWVQ